MKNSIKIQDPNFPNYDISRDFEQSKKIFYEYNLNDNKEIIDKLENSKQKCIVGVKSFKYNISKKLLYRKYIQLVYADVNSNVAAIV